MDSSNFSLFSKEILSGQRLVWIITVFLFLGVMYLGGTLTGRIIHQEILNTSISVPSLKIPPKKPLPKDPGIPRGEFTTILDRNIFNAKRKAVPVPLRPPPSNKILVETPSPQSPPPPPKSKLNIELRGTIVTSSNRNTYAFIGRKNGSQEKIFGLEECFTPSKLEKDRECAPENVKVVKIQKQKIMVTYQGEKEWLELTKGPKTKIKRAIKPQSPKRPKSPKRAPRISKKVRPSKKKFKAVVESPPVLESPKVPKRDLGPQETVEMNLQREWVDEQLANFSKVLQDSRVDATTKNGKTYFQFKMIKEGSMYEILGLQRGDIIISINNVIIDNLPKALSLFQKLQSEREIALVVERGDVRQKMRYFIN